MKSGECTGIALIIPDQTTKADSPGKGTFDHPPARQQDKALLGFGQLHHLQPNAFPLGGSGGFGI